MTLYGARLETPNFLFETFATDTAHALQLMHRAWDTHRRQTQAADVWEDVEEDVHLRQIVIGRAYRDGVEL